MIPIKNREGIAKMRETCAIAATVLHKLKKLVLPGVTTQDLEEAGRKYIADLGATSACFGYRHGSRRYPAHTCISVNEEVVHGIPSFRKVLREGDIVSLDIVVFYNGYVGDNAYTMPVGSVAPAVEKLLRVSKEALDLGIKQARVGNRIGDISYAIQTHCEASGLSVVREMVGHGVGVAMHEPLKSRTSAPRERREDQTRDDPRNRTHGQPWWIQDQDPSGRLDSCDLRRTPLRSLRTYCAHVRYRA